MIDAALRYSAPAKFFHWLSAATILTAIVLGFAMLESDPGPRQNQFFDLHRSFGFVILLLTAAHGTLAVFCRRHRRYRTSPTRPSARATNVEFVLLCDTRLPCSASDADRVLTTIGNTTARELTSDA